MEDNNDYSLSLDGDANYVALMDNATGDNEGNEDMDDDGEDLVGSAETSEQNSGGTKKRKYSPCWKHFRVIGNMRSDGKHHVRCKHCPQSYWLKLTSGTNTMLRHSKRCANTPGSTPKVVNRKVDMLVFRDMIAAALVEHNLPFAFVEYKRIRMAFNYLNPEVQTWCRNTAATDCLKIFEREKIKLKKSLSEIPGRVCLTTDLWRSLTIEGYMYLTAHYVDTDWSLKAKIIAFCAFRPPHSGIRIAMRLNELLKEWGLEKKVFSLTAHNASANDNMQGILKGQLQKDLVSNGDFFHVRCSAHILNLIVQDGLTVIGVALQKIRDSVKFVKASESRELMFESCMESLGIQANGGLILDVSTRWNSTYLMLSRALKFRSVLRKLADVEKSYACLPSALEWRRGEMICEFLKPFYEMTNLISGSSYPTANLYFMQVCKIECWLRTHAFSSDEVIVEMVEAMQLKFDKYWEEYNDILAIAAVFDPRLKFTFLEYCFKTLDSSTCQAKLAHVKEKMTTLFEAYETDETSSATSQIESSKDIPDDYSGFYAFYSQNVVRSGKSALDKYLDEPSLDMVQYKSLDVLTYWKDNSIRFKELARMACDVLSIPITTVASESSFSIGSRVLHKYRSRLLPSNVQALICARNWLRVNAFEETDDDDEFDFLLMGEKEQDQV